MDQKYIGSGHFISAVDPVGPEGSVEHPAVVVEGEFLAVGVTEGLEQSAFYLAAGRDRIDSYSTVHGHNHVVDRDLAGLGVEFDFDEG